MRGATAWLAACSIALVAVRALAQDDGAVRLEWNAEASCPLAAAFLAQVHARSTRVRIDPRASRTVVVRITRAGGKVTGRIDLNDEAV